MTPTRIHTDVVVVGAGPAGLAAAVTALAGGLNVVLVDAGHALGGQYWRHPPDGSALAARPGAHALGHDLDTYAALRGALGAYERSGRAVVLLQHHAWTAVVGESASAPDHVQVHVVDHCRTTESAAPVARVVTGRRLVVATGAYDRPLPFPGWDLPGVFTAGALQALLKSGRVAAGQRVVVAGTGPFLLPVAAGLAEAGSRVVAVCEAAGLWPWSAHLGAAAGVPGKALEGARYAATLARHRIPVHLRTAVVAAHGADRVDAVTVARLDTRGSVVAGTSRRWHTDVVGTGWGFVPQLDLPITLGCALGTGAGGGAVVVVDAGQRSSVPGVLVAGEACGVGGALLALREGQLAGETVLGELADLGAHPVTGPARLRTVRRQIARQRRFAAAMHAVHRVPDGWPAWLTDETILCRCEEVTVAQVRAAVAEGATSARQVKQLTRAGMGWCQGRMCGYAAHALATSAGSRPPAPPEERLVAAPVPLGALATLDSDRDDPERDDAGRNVILHSPVDGRLG